MNDNLNGIVSYLKSVKLEWAKITWPERKQVIAETFAVVAIIFVFTVAVYLIDIIFKAILGFIPSV
ncbi:preprotein translocase subunit SecE [bacterium]|nr:preprotein translocase subunit SecE [bacterium]